MTKKEKEGERNQQKNDGGVVVGGESIRETIKTELPSFPGSKVILYKSLLFGQTREISKLENEQDAGVKVLEYLIKDWNLTDEDGEKLEVSSDVFNKLPMEDMTHLMNKMTDFLKMEAPKKKNLPNKQ